MYQTSTALLKTIMEAELDFDTGPFKKLTNFQSSTYQKWLLD